MNFDNISTGFSFAYDITKRCLGDSIVTKDATVVQTSTRHRQRLQLVNTKSDFKKMSHVEHQHCQLQQ